MVRLLDKATSTFTEGALLSVTVHVAAAPLATVVGVQEMADSVAETRTMEVLAVLPLSVAVICAVPSAVGVPACAVKVALEAPCGTDRVVGTVSCALLSAIVTVKLF